MRIIVFGGLGNQMFQYALYLALREKGKKAKLDTSLFSHLTMHNGYELERCFGIRAPQVTVTEWSKIKLRFLLKFKPSIIIFEDKKYYTNGVFNTNCLYLSGYWQSEKYFKFIESKIRKAFEFQNINNKNKKIAEDIASRTSVSLHLRRGDYVGNQLYTGVCNEEYYAKAITLLINLINPQIKPQFYLFSDDKEYAKQFASKHNISATVITCNKAEDNYQDMYLMSQCKHNIMANSSFSWWGAWLNNNHDKIVIAPERWFNPGTEDTWKDIVPETWIKIK